MLSAARLSGVLASMRRSAVVPKSDSEADLAEAVLTAWQEESQSIISVNGQSETTATVIFSHGLGDTGDGWAQGFAYEVARHMNHVRFLFPTARQIPVTLNMGMRMPAWYDIPSLDRDRLAMEAKGITDSVSYIQSIALVEEARLAEVLPKGTSPSSRIIIGGFSQGAALSYMAGHTYPRQLAAIMALSGYLTARPDLENHWEAANNATPIFAAHGRQDPVVPFDSGKESAELIAQMKAMRAEKAGSPLAEAPVSFNAYNMEHCSCPDEMQAVVEFLHKKLPRL